jgi:leucyl aminopeptidase
LGEETGERVASLPFWDDYKEQLKSDIADFKNLGGPTAGAITAGKFLEYFVSYDWLHLDVAGPAYTHKPVHYTPVGGTGFGIRLLVSYIADNQS